jgi:YD repeat-containing protein
VNASLGETNFVFDANGNVVEVRDEKTNLTQYTYDDFDRLSGMAYADGSAEEYGYDAASNVTRFQDSAQRSSSSTTTSAGSSGGSVTRAGPTISLPTTRRAA